MKTINIKTILLFICITGFFALLSCEKDDEKQEVPRLFRPIIEVDSTYMENTLIVKWKLIEGASSYYTEISKDNFQTIDSYMITNTDTVSANPFYDEKYGYAIFTDLLAATQYFVRIRANNTDQSMNSEYYIGSGTTRSIFINPPTNEILDYAFIARWDKSGDLLSKMIIKDANTDTLIAELVISLIDNREGYKIIDGLKGNTTYNISLYSRETLRGKGTVTTREAIAGDILVDLRGIDNEEVLYDTLDGIESGSVLILKGGMTYNFPASVQIPVSVVIRKGYSFNTEPTILNLKGNPFKIPDNGLVDSIVFMDLSIQSTYESNSYVFYLAPSEDNPGATYEINTVKFQNVNSNGHRGFFRVGLNSRVSNLIIENCVIDSLREYGITHIDGAGSYLENTLITNSTFRHVVRPFYCRSATMTSSNTLTIENCTFYHCCDGGRFFFDYFVPVKVTMNNCIIGNSVGIFSKTDPPQGYRISSGNDFVAPINITYPGSYMTNDFIQAVAGEEGTPIEPILYNASSEELFADPDNKDFTLIDGSFPGVTTAGDPRWSL